MLRKKKMSYTRRTKSSVGRNGGEDRSITDRARMNELMKSCAWFKDRILCKERGCRKEVTKVPKMGFRKTDVGYTMNSGPKYTQIEAILERLCGLRNFSLF